MSAREGRMTMHGKAGAGQDLGRGGIAAFAAMGSVYFFSHFQRTAIPGTIFDQLQSEFALSAAGVAALGSLFTWIYGGMQIVVGILVDAWGGRRALLLGGLAMALGSLAFPLAGVLPLLLAARILTGFGASFIYLAIVKEIGVRLVPRQFSAALGAILAVGYCGAMAGTLPFERAIGILGWRPALLLVAALTFAALAAALLQAPSAARGPRASAPPPIRSLGIVLSNRNCLPSFGSSAIAFPLYFVVLTFLGKKFLEDFGGLGSAAAAATLLAMSATSAVTVLLGGVLPQRFGGRRKPFLIGSSFLLAATLALLLGGTLLHAPAVAYLVGYILLAAATGLGNPSSTATMKDLNPPELLASAISVINALSYLGCGTVAWLCGLILDGFRPAGQAAIVVYPQAAYLALFSFLLLLALVNIAFTLAIPETGGKRHPSEASL